MINSKRIRTLFSILLLLIASPMALAQAELEDQHIRVAMRLIGHEVLLQAGDSTSRVMPIEKEKNRYRIQFNTEFEIIPQLLSATIDSVMDLSNIASSYIVELIPCESDEILYSYEVNPIQAPSFVPCAARILPKTCYSIYISLFDISELEAELKSDYEKEEAGAKTDTFYYNSFLIILLIALVLFMAYLRYNRIKNGEIQNDGLIQIGNYKFNPLSSELFYESTRYELTAKESDLLLLLFNSANTTLEKEFILKKVWGDEGDYIGRTLDVFISKLRKKLELDNKLKIVNIRGVGYKLAVLH